MRKCNDRKSSRKVERYRQTSGGQILDISQPEVRNYLLELFQDGTGSWFKNSIYRIQYRVPIHEGRALAALILQFWPSCPCFQSSNWVQWLSTVYSFDWLHLDIQLHMHSLTDSMLILVNQTIPALYCPSDNHRQGHLHPCAVPILDYQVVHQLSLAPSWAPQNNQSTAHTLQSPLCPFPSAFQSNPHRHHHH